MSLSEYLKPIKNIISRDKQQKWFFKLEETAIKGQETYQACDENVRRWVWDEFRNRVRTEEIKAWYSEPEGNSLFQGTSVSSLTIPYKTQEPLNFNSMNDMEESIADAYIELHYKYIDKVKNAILENVDRWISEGLYYGVVVSSKVISQSLNFFTSHDDVIFDVNGYHVDPHEITSYPQKIRGEYFNKCRNKIECFTDLDLEQKEFESSLVLADISKPKINKYRNKIMLAPIRCNEIAAVLSERIVGKIKEKTFGKIKPRSLVVVIYDTDTPYTYHQIMGYNNNIHSPVLPGLTILGSSGTIDAFRWLYDYRISLIAQKIQKSSLYSQVHKCFMPFVFFGVLVPRDAEILLDMDNLHRLRYKGNFSPDIEFSYFIPKLLEGRASTQSIFSWEQFREEHFI